MPKKLLEKRKAQKETAKTEGRVRGVLVIVCGGVGRLNEPEKQPNKPQGEDLTNERKPGERGVWGCGVCRKALSHEAECGARWTKKEPQLQPKKPLATNKDLEREDARRRESCQKSEPMHEFRGNVHESFRTKLHDDRGSLKIIG